MKTTLKLKLEQALELWLGEASEDHDCPDVWFYDDLAEDMAAAAALVFDANGRGQAFKAEQEDES